MAYNSSFNLESMVVPLKAATVYAAHEASQFLGGEIIPVVNIPAGSASLQVPLMGSVTATKLTSESQDDIANSVVTDTSVSIPAAIYAARTVLRDLGGIDPSDIGRILGNGVSAKFDADVAAQLESTSITNEIDTAGTVSLDFILEAVETIRTAGEMGPLFGVLSPAMATNLLKNIGTAAYAGSNFQGNALQNADLGVVGGVRFITSSYMTANQGTIFAGDAFRIGMFKNIDIEIGRRPEAVGNTVVGNLHAGVGLVDAARACRLYDVA